MTFLLLLLHINSVYERNQHKFTVRLVLLWDKYHNGNDVDYTIRTSTKPVGMEMVEKKLGREKMLTRYMKHNIPSGVGVFSIQIGDRLMTLVHYSPQWFRKTAVTIFFLWQWLSTWRVTVPLPPRPTPRPFLPFRPLLIDNIDAF